MQPHWLLASEHQQLFEHHQRNRGDKPIKPERRKLAADRGIIRFDVNHRTHHMEHKLSAKNCDIGSLNFAWTGLACTDTAWPDHISPDVAMLTRRVKNPSHAKWQASFHPPSQYLAQ